MPAITPIASSPLSGSQTLSPQVAEQLALAPVPTQSQAQQAIVAFLAAILPVGIEIVEGQDNRVPEPGAVDFVALWPIRRRRLATNIDTYDPIGQTQTMLAKWELAMQFDVHGPNSSDNAAVISSAFRDGFAVDFFADFSSAVVPIHADDPKQVPFINDQQQVEYRWIIEALLQEDILLTVPLPSALAIAVDLIEVDTTYPP